MLAFFTARGRGEADPLLADLAAALTRQGMRLAGAVQVNVERTDRRRCDMELQILTGTGRVRISQDLGPHSRSCRLDPDGLSRAVLEVEAALAEGRADLVLLNKFGKEEALGRGFQPVIAAAMERGLPVLLAVAPSNLAAFVAFADGLAEELPPDPAALAAWCRRAASAPQMV